MISLWWPALVFEFIAYIIPRLRRYENLHGVIDGATDICLALKGVQGSGKKDADDMEGMIRYDDIKKNLSWSHPGSASRRKENMRGSDRFAHWELVEYCLMPYNI